MAQAPVYVTSEGFKKLEEELELLRTVKRAEVAQRLHEAMEDGELIENAEYEAAKNEQAFVEGRILELEHTLAVAKVIEPGGPTDVIRVGSTVQVQENGKKPEEYKIVGAAEASPKDGLISNESPLGKSLLDHRAGDEVEVKAPAGTLHFRIVKVKELGVTVLAPRCLGCAGLFSCTLLTPLGQRREGDRRSREVRGGGAAPYLLRKPPPPPASAARNGEAAEGPSMSPLTELERVRSEKAEKLRQAGVDPYPPRSSRTHTTQEALRAFEQAPPGAEVQATVVGRLRSIRRMGKAIFAHVEDGAGKLQLFLRADELGAERLALFDDLYDLGDFIQASGALFRTRTGETTLRVGEFTMLAKAVTPLPAAKTEVVDGVRTVHSPFANPEARYRERYADLAVNPEVREIFGKRAAVIRALRRFLDGHGFLEVETPILQPIYGGAAAQPFITHHNQLHQDLYLRISFELYLKRLLVGGIERVYEIGRDFRNEGISYKNNPEFTMLEFYMAYADYRDVMRLTEEMVAAAALEVNGSTKIVYQGQEVELAPPWPRLDLRATLRERSGLDVVDYPTADDLRRAMVVKGHDPAPGATRGKLVESLLAHYIEPTLVQPAFVCDYPRDISPLAKSRPDDPGTVERFEAYALGMELCNAFTELNDPADQEARFLELRRLYQAGDEERHPLDEDYLRAMRYGMPPCGGFGMGVDRLTMILTGQSTIREVILFPLLREKD